MILSKNKITFIVDIQTIVNIAFIQFLIIKLNLVFYDIRNMLYLYA